MTPALSPTLIDRYVQVEEQLERRPSMLTSFGEEPSSSGEGWYRALERLRQWLVSPSALDDDETEPPSVEIIRTATSLLQAFRKQGLPDDFFPSPNGRGGVCFERRSGPLFEEYELEKEGRVTQRRYLDGRLIQKSVLGWIPVTAGSEQA